MATAERWPLWRGGSCGVGYEQTLFFSQSVERNARDRKMITSVTEGVFDVRARVYSPHKI